MSGITIHAPTRRGRNWVLRADVKVGAYGDTITITAAISPESLAWLASTARNGGAWAKRWIDRIGERVGLRLAGDWSRFGVVATILQRLAIQAGESAMLTPYQAIVDAVPLYRAANGEMGPAMAQRAQGTVSQIEQTYETDPAAREARDCLRVLGDVDAIIYAGKGYELADYCRRKAMSDERAMAMLQAMQALGCESGRAHTNVTIDVDPYLVGQGADVASRAAHVRALRSLHRCPRPLSTAELSAYLESVTPAHVRDACCVSCAIDQSGQSCIPPCVESGRKPGKPGKPSRPHEPDEPQRMPPWRVPGQTTTMVPDQTPTLPGGQTASMGPDQTATLPGGMTTGMVADQLAQINQGALGISQRPNQRPDRPSAYTQGNAIMQAGKAYFRSA